MTRRRHHAETDPRPRDEGTRPPATDGEERPGPSEGDLHEELNRLRAREDELLRAVAEMTNAQRRRKLETEQTVRYATETLIQELLPVLDDFERALRAIPGGSDDPIRAGVALVHDRLRGILEREGLAPIHPAGEPFDPNLHDAIGERVAPPGVKPGTVLDVAQTGYRLPGRVLRHAKVVVAGPPAIGRPAEMLPHDERPPDTIPPPAGGEMPPRRGSERAPT